MEMEKADVPNPLIGVIVLPPPAVAARNVVKLDSLPCPILTTTAFDEPALANAQLTPLLISSTDGRGPSEVVVATSPMYALSNDTGIALHELGGCSVPAAGVEVVGEADAVAEGVPLLEVGEDEPHAATRARHRKNNATVAAGRRRRKPGGMKSSMGQLPRGSDHLAANSIRSHEALVVQRLQLSHGVSWRRRSARRV